jgi:lysine 6-dehydrogenase
MLVLGAGLQGSACAYDLLQNPDVKEVRLADLKVDHLPSFLASYSGKRLLPTVLDVRDAEAVRAVMKESDAVMSAIPYYFNLDLAKHAVDVGVHFCDLGGNTEIVFKQKELDAKARAKNITIVPDCGVAPGMVNILAQHGIEQLDKVKALSEREVVKFPAPVGELEAFHTAGGLSTMAWRYEGKIPTMEYKTLRYKGHAQLMEAIRDLGLLDLDPVDVKGNKVIPRDAFISTVGPKLTKPKGKDLLALRVTVEGTKGGKAKTLGWQLIDSYDEKHGVSAMMRTTGYSLSITGQLQVQGEVKPAGVHTPDECMPAERYIEELAKRGIDIRSV